MKAVLLWKKQEKRIIKLLYRTGLLQEHLGYLKIDVLYWEHYRSLCRKRKRAGKYFRTVYLPEVHYCTMDYWGEGNEHPIVTEIIDSLSWQYGKVVDDEMWPDITGLDWLKSRDKFIKWLSSQPIKVHDSKINKVLNLGYNSL